jgi:excisionase family DNA binding protein
MTMIAESDFLHVEEIARVCRAPKSSVRHWISTGKLPSIKPGERRLVRRQDLDRFLRTAGPRGMAGKVAP